jgi:hypothetical protein
MKIVIIVWAVATCGLVSIGVAQSESPAPEGRAEESVVPIQEGSARAPDRFAKSENAKAMQEVARLTVEANVAFDRGDLELGRARARTAAGKLKSIEERITETGSGRARSKLAEQRGRLQLEFLGDEEAAREAFEDALVADDNPLAERLLIELIERKERRTNSRTPGLGN